MGVNFMNNFETKVDGAAGKSGRGFSVWLVVVLVVVTIGLYWPATRHDFVSYDDGVYVTENSQVQGGLTWTGLKWAFLNPVIGNWHPLTVLSHMLDCQLFGLNPWGHHLTSVLLHAVNTALVFLLFQRLTGAFWRSAMVAGLFGWHPVHVESVAWVAERRDVLSACFGLLALIYYVRYAQNKTFLNTTSSVALAKEDQRLGAATCLGEAMRRRKRSGDGSTFNYVLALVFFAFGLMSKAMVVTWPFVMLLLDWWPLERFKVRGSGFKVRSLVWEKVPFFGLAVVISIVTFVVQNQAGTVTSIATLSLSERAENALISYCRYLGKMFWPVDLAVFYPYSRHWPMEEVLLGSGLLLGITVLCIMVRRRYPFMLTGWLWYGGTLVPVIQLVQTGSHAMADRYTYVPSIGVLVMVVWGVYELTRWWRHQVMILSVAGGAAIILCLGITRQQLGYWQDSETLFRHALEVTDNNYLAHNNFGFMLAQRGQLDEAISHFQEAIWLKPDYSEAYNNLGFVFDKRGQLDEAITQYQEAIRLKPDDAEVHCNLGIVLGQKGQIAEAVGEFQEAIRLRPEYAEAHYHLGVALGKLGRLDEAVKQYREAIRLKPDYADAHGNLANVLSVQGKLNEADQEYRRTIELVPNSAPAHLRYGQALAAEHRYGAAKGEYEKVLELHPGHREASESLAWLLATCPDSSLRNGEEAVKLGEGVKAPGGNESPQFLDTLGAAYAEAGEFEKAVATARRALELPAVRSDPSLAEGIQTRLELYEAKTPYHERP